MKLINNTSFCTTSLPGKGPGGTDGISIVVKGTFTIHPGLPATISSSQIPLFETDQYLTTPDESSAIVESDFILHKNKADIIILGSAYYVTGSGNVCILTISIGAHSASIRVSGNRKWDLSGMTPVITSPLPFTSIPLQYEYAFGGKDGEDVYSGNPFGKGYCTDLSHAHGLSLPNLEDPNPAFLLNNNPLACPPACAPAWVGRAWSPRKVKTGTLTAGAKSLPADFSWDFFNAAYPLFQMAYPNGNEFCHLTNCTPDGSLSFFLPGKTPKVTIQHSTGTINPVMHLDTIVFLLDTQIADVNKIKQPWKNAFYLVWRVHVPLPSSIKLSDVQVAIIE